MNEKVIRGDLEVTRTEATAVECVTQYIMHYMSVTRQNDGDFELSAMAGIFKTTYTDSGKEWPMPCDDFQRSLDLCACGDGWSFLGTEMGGARYVVRAMFERFEFQCERVD